MNGAARGSEALLQLGQACPLVHPEAVLFIHDGKAKLPEPKRSLGFERIAPQ
jgi:hypothetical protein